MPSQKPAGRDMPVLVRPPCRGDTRTVCKVAEVARRCCASPTTGSLCAEASPRNLEAKVPRLSGPPLHLWLRDHGRKFAEASRR
jgi:hypothetical protein